MPSPKSHRRGQAESSRKGKLGDRSSSFHGESHVNMSGQLRRPKTLPELHSFTAVSGASPDGFRRQLPKLLLNVTMIGSLGPVQVVMTPDSSVKDLVAASVKQYAKECRRPILPTTDPSAFDLHYSQFSLESLDREKKLMELGSRNFILCPKKSSAVAAEAAENGGNGGGVKTPLGSCCKQADKATKDTKAGFGWLRFML